MSNVFPLGLGTTKEGILISSTRRACMLFKPARYYHRLFSKASAAGSLDRHERKREVDLRGAFSPCEREKRLLHKVDLLVVVMSCYSPKASTSAMPGKGAINTAVSAP